MVGTSLQPIDRFYMTGMESVIDDIGTVKVEATENNIDRDGWRAMDGHRTDTEMHRTGWYTTSLPANWVLEFPENTNFTVKSLKFYNTSVEEGNYSKNVKVWVNNETNVVGQFMAEPSDNGLTNYVIQTPQAGTIFGLTVEDSYSDGNSGGAQ